jgi:uncharacterized protein involved in cysteine biosynthesis
MKVADLWESYTRYTRDLTEHGRTLGFAGVAICWLLKNNDLTFPLTIYIALFFFVLYFIADVSQALCGALQHKKLAERLEHELRVANKPDDTEIDKPRSLDWPAFRFFLAKGVLLAMGFGFIAIHLFLVWVRSLLNVKF